MELKGCHTQGETVGELLENIKEAIELYSEVETSYFPYVKDIVGIQKIAI